MSSRAVDLVGLYVVRGERCNFLSVILEEGDDIVHFLKDASLKY